MAWQARTFGRHMTARSLAWLSTQAPIVCCSLLPSDSQAANEPSPRQPNPTTTYPAHTTLHHRPLPWRLAPPTCRQLCLRGLPVRQRAQLKQEGAVPEGIKVHEVRAEGAGQDHLGWKRLCSLVHGSPLHSLQGVDCWAVRLVA